MIELMCDMYMKLIGLDDPMDMRTNESHDLLYVAQNRGNKRNYEAQPQTRGLGMKEWVIL